ncbi:MAG: AmmeMemoRadiSam system protein B [Kineosporiaceae bacterium]
MGTRPPAVAGHFYPRDVVALASTVDGLLDTAAASGAAAPDAPLPWALMVPHAGYVYSGPVAASGYAALRGHCETLRRVVLLGPSHYVALEGMATAAATRWSTPLGEVAVERAPGVPADDRPHAADHALEVQLPFLQRLLPHGFTVVPIAVGRTAAEEVADLLALVRASLPGLVVVSSDLSHYHDAVTASRLDRRTASAVLDLDPAAIGSEDACGAWALRGLLVHARRRGSSVSMLDLRNSADTAGNPSRVVGYGAFSFTDPG